MTTDDRHLLAAYAENGDADCFAELIARHRDMVYSAALRLTSEPSDAEDATQEAFLRLARSANRVRMSAGAWLHRTVVNAAVDALRRDGSRRAREREAAFLAENDRREPSWDDLKLEVDRAIDSLPEKLRRPIVLHYLEGKSQKIVAEELGVSRSAIHQRIKVGVAHLREQLGRAGTAASAAALGGLLTQNAVQAAPAAVAAELAKLALSGVGSAPVAASAAKPLVAKLGGSWAAKLTCGVLAVALLGVAAHQVTRKLQHTRTPQTSGRAPSGASGATAGPAGAATRRSAARPPVADADIWSAGALGDLGAIGRHLVAGADIDGTFVEEGAPGSGGTPLHIAVLADQAGAVRFLIEKGADVNVRAENKRHNAPLHWAAAYGRAEAVDLLVQRGADVNARDAEGEAPLHHAAVFGRARIARALLQAGADPEAKNDDGGAPSGHAAAPWEFTQEIAALMGLDVDRDTVEAGRAEIRKLLAQRR